MEEEVEVEVADEESEEETIEEEVEVEEEEEEEEEEVEEEEIMALVQEVHWVSQEVEDHHLGILKRNVKDKFKKL